MSAPIKNIQLSFACHEDWEKMTPCALGKFCDSCKKPVYDFTDRSKEDLQKVLSENQGSVCGRFTRNQLSDKKNYFGFMKTALATAALFFGLTISLKAQEKLGKVKMGEVGRPMIHAVYSKGGESGLVKYMEENIHLKNNERVGLVTVHYSLDTLGNVASARVSNGLGWAVNNEILRVVKSLSFTWEKGTGTSADDISYACTWEQALVFEVNKNVVRCTVR